MAPDPPARGNRLVIATALAGAAAILTLELLVAPLIGLANNGDFDRVMGWAGLRYLPNGHDENPAAWVPTRFAIERFAYRPTNYLSSEAPVAALAVLAARMFPTGGVFDIRILGTFHILLLLAALGLLLSACRDLAAATQWIVAGLLVFVFTDVGYAASLNSLYVQSAAVLFGLLTVAVAARSIRLGRWESGPLAVYVALALLFVGSRPQESIQGPVLAAFAVALALRSREPPRRMAIRLAVGLCVFSLAYAIQTPRWYRQLALYDLLHLELLPASPDPSGDLAELGLGSELLRYRGVSPYTTDGRLPDDASAARRIGGFGYGTLARFYLLHPRRLASRLEQAARSAFHLRPLGLGNYAKESGMPRHAMTRRFAWWSDSREALASRAPLWLALFFAGNLAAVSLGYRRASARGRLFRQGLALLIVMTAAEFLVAVFGISLGDAARHLCVFHALSDLLLIADVAWLVQTLIAGKRQPERALA
jgi:hypothetical protein